MSTSAVKSWCFISCCLLYSLFLISFLDPLQFLNIFCDFTVTPSKIKMQTSQYRTSRIGEMEEDKCTKSLASNQVCAIIHLWNIWKNFLPKFIRLCMETPCWCPFEGHKYGRRKPKETSGLEFSYLCDNSSLEELIKIKVIFILRQGTVQTHIRAFPAAS